MYDYETKDFCQYTVYSNTDFIDGQPKQQNLCVCHEFSIAKNIAICLARQYHGITFHVTGVFRLDDFVPGGGWEESFFVDEKGVLHHSTLG